MSAGVKPPHAHAQHSPQPWIAAVVAAVVAVVSAFVPVAAQASAAPAPASQTV